MMVNHSRRQEGKTIVGRNAVMFVFHRMRPTITRIKNPSQGNVYHAHWNVARWAQTKQINVMIGKITLGDLQTEYINSTIP